jgi:hypothetical protein
MVRFSRTFPFNQRIPGIFDGGSLLRSLRGTGNLFKESFSTTPAGNAAWRFTGGVFARPLNLISLFRID